MNATDQFRAAFAALAIRVMRVVEDHRVRLSPDGVASRLAEIDRRGRALRRIHVRQNAGYFVRRDGRLANEEDAYTRRIDLDEQSVHEEAIAQIERELNPRPDRPIMVTICADPKSPPIAIAIEGKVVGHLGCGKEG